MAGAQATNPGTQLARIAKTAGLDKIPRPLDNMRATRATEIYVEFGEHYEKDWIGHSIPTALKHYLFTRKADFKRAAMKTLDYPRKEWDMCQQTS